MFRLTAVSLSVVATLVACGGSSNPPPASASPEPSVTAESPIPADTAAAPVVDAGTAPVVDAGPPAPKPPGTLAEAPDECTPVGVDFEKRARPKLKECYATGKKKDANLEGTVKIKMTVDVKGKIKSVKVVEKTLPDPVADCMLKVVKATPFPEVEKCWDSTITIPITFPTPK